MTKKLERITLTPSEYHDLCSDAQFLAALEHEGVIHWEGYQRAIDLWKTWKPGRAKSMLVKRERAKLTKP